MKKASTQANFNPSLKLAIWVLILKI